MDFKKTHTLPDEHTDKSSPLFSSKEQSPEPLEYLPQRYPIQQEKEKNSFSKPNQNRSNSNLQKTRQKSLDNRSSKPQTKQENRNVLMKENSKKISNKIKEQDNKTGVQEYLIVLEGKIDQQQKKIKNIKATLEDRKRKFEEYSQQLKENKRFEKLIETYEFEKQRIEKNEQTLIKNLTQQQKLTKEALSRLYSYQEESLKEKGQMKDFYEAQLKEQILRMDNKYKTKIKALKLKNNELLKQETFTKDWSMEISSLKAEISSFQKENEMLIRENQALKTQMQERREHVENEIQILRERMENDNENYRRENEEKQALKQKIQSLLSELDGNHRKTRENEQFYKTEIEKLEEKIELLEDKLRNNHENKSKIDEIMIMLQRKEQECASLKSQLLQEKRTQTTVNAMNVNNQKREWSKIYSELMDEINCLKSEIDLLGNENKRLLSSNTNTRFGSESQQAFLSSHRFS